MNTPLHTKESQLKNVICIDPEDFTEVIAKIYPNIDPYIEFSLDGLTVSDENEVTRNLLNDLSTYYNVEVVSVHLDNGDPPCVWIVYQ